MKTITSIVLLFVVVVTMAQSYDEEALLYSGNALSGTARTVGVAGAFGSVGADIACLTINPAGLGLFRATDFSVSPGLLVNSNRATYLNSSVKASSTSLYFGQAGLAFTKIIRKASSPNEISFNPQRVKSFTIGINYQRQSFFTRKINFSATNPAYSNADGYTAYLNNTQYPLDFNNYPPEVILMRDLAVIFRDTTDGNYYNNIPTPVRQSGMIDMKGAKDEIDLGFGINVNDKVYVGFGLGIPLLTYSYTSSFTEATTQLDDTFNNYSLYSYLTARGVGVNSTFGLIYRPVSWLRVGLAYQMPSFFSVSDNYEVDAEADYDTAYLSTGVKYDPFKYKFRSPMKGIASASFFIRQYAFIAVDYELMNSGASRYNFGKGYESFSADENGIIKNQYGFTHTLRVGVEGAIKWLRLRAGYRFTSSPFKKNYLTKGFDASTHSITAGLGYRGKRFYADFVYVYEIGKDVRSLLALDPLQNTQTMSRAMLTLGWHFSKQP